MTTTSGSTPARPTFPIHTQSTSRQSSQQSPQPLPLVRSRTPAHLPLYRRLLFPNLSLNEDVPLLVGDGDGNEKNASDDQIKLINERLYHLIALGLRAYVQSWYIRFSKDRSLLPSINTNIIIPTLSPILRGIYDDPDKLCELLLLDIPSILALHIRTYWESRAAISLVGNHSQDAGGGRLAKAYHDRLPLLSVSVQKEEEEEEGREYTLSPVYLTALGTSLFPQSITEVDVQKYIAREIVARSILLSTSRRLSQPWFWYSLLLKFLGEPDDDEAEQSNTQSKPTSTSTTPSKQERPIPEILWDAVLRIIGIIGTIWSLGMTLTTLYTASPPLSTKGGYHNCSRPIIQLVKETIVGDGITKVGLKEKRWITRIIWGAVELLLVLLSPFLDRLLPHLIHTYLLTPNTALKTIDILERLLFPDGYPGPSPIDPTKEESLSLKITAEKRIAQLVPHPIRTIFLPSDQDVFDLLAPLDNSSCNNHLIAMFLNSSIAAIRPDLVINLDHSSETQS